MAEEPKRDPVRSLSNRIFLKISGKWFRAYSIVRHVGRTSGRQYRNPVSAYPLGDGFVIAVLYGGVELGRQRRAGRHRGRYLIDQLLSHDQAAAPCGGAVPV